MLEDILRLVRAGDPNGALQSIQAAGDAHEVAIRFDGLTRELYWNARDVPALAFNLASFLWPGWDEPGIALSPTDEATGMNAARLNLRLATELDRPPAAIQDAHWLLGAHLLAAGDLVGARAEFAGAAPESRPLYAGYLRLADALAGTPGAPEEFQRFLAALRAAPAEDSAASHEQLATAYRVFLRRADPAPVGGEQLQEPS